MGFRQSRLASEAQLRRQNDTPMIFPRYFIFGEKFQASKLNANAAHSTCAPANAERGLALHAVAP